MGPTSTGPRGPSRASTSNRKPSGTNLDWARGPDDGPSCRLKVGPVGSKSYTDLDWAPAQLGSVPVEMGPLEAEHWAPGAQLGFHVEPKNHLGPTSTGPGWPSRLLKLGPDDYWAQLGYYQMPNKIRRRKIFQCVLSPIN